jgi:sec-independent protein translocase protein TatB
MFDIGWQELFVIGLLALIVVGPKDLPRVIRTISGVIRKAKGMAREFQSGLDEVVREAELDDMRKELTAQGDDLAKEIAPPDLTGDLAADLDFSKETMELEAAANAEPDAASSDVPSDTKKTG